MSVRPRELDARLAWNLLCGSRTPSEPNEPIKVPAEELRVLWQTWRSALLSYWREAVDLPTADWPAPVKEGPSWGELVFDREDVSDEEARRILDDLMGWEPPGSDGDARGA